MSEMSGSNSNPVGSSSRRRSLGILRRRRSSIPECEADVNAVDVNEVRALIRFASERGGTEDESKLLSELSRLTDAYAEHQKSVPDLAIPECLEISENRALIIAKYAKLCEHTYGEYRVNGRSILDSVRHSDDAIVQALGWGALFLFFAVVPDLLFFYFDEASFLHGVIVGLIHFSAFFWGGVGSSVFLLKTFGEIAASSRFDQRKLQGVAVRVFLGAAVAYIVVEVFDLAGALGGSEDDALPFQLGKAAIAFLAGLGVKAFYGAFEALIEAIHEWFSRGRRTRGSR